jgi:hypothetical protein
VAALTVIILTKSSAVLTAAILSSAGCNGDIPALLRAIVSNFVLKIAIALAWSVPSLYFPLLSALSKIKSTSLSVLFLRTPKPPHRT